MTVQNVSATRTGPLAGLTAVLIDALAALGAAGDPETACRLAGRAYAVLRHEHPGHAQRINALMHRLVRISSPTEE